MLGQFKRVVYVQLARERLTVRDPRSGQAISERPDIAVKRGRKRDVVAVGNEARAAALNGDVAVVNPFAHPRSLLSDFTLADQVLKAFLRRLPPSSFFRLSPAFVIHPIGEFEGGLTQIELRAMRELGLGAGASEVILWQGPALTDEQLLNQAYPTSGKVLSE